MPPPASAVTRRKERRSIAVCVMTTSLSTRRRRGDLGRALDAFADPQIGTAAADVAIHRGIDLYVGWLVVGAEQRGGRHNLAGLTVAALRHVDFSPRDLQRVVAGR